MVGAIERRDRALITSARGRLGLWLRLSRQGDRPDSGQGDPRPVARSPRAGPLAGLASSPCEGTVPVGHLVQREEKVGKEVVDRTDLVEQTVIESSTCSVAFCSRANRTLFSTGTTSSRQP